MNLLLRNVTAVLTLQPARFVEPHPGTLQRYVVGSVLVAGWASLMLPPQKVILFYVFGLAALWLRPTALARAFGSTGPWRAAFALTWCTTTAAALSALAGSGLVDALLCAYVVLGVGLQSRSAATPDGAVREREALRAFRRAFSVVDGARAHGLTRSGTVMLLEVGPAAAYWHDREIPAYVVDVMRRRWVFSSTLASTDTHVLDDRQLLLPPGALYELQ